MVAVDWVRCPSITPVTVPPRRDNDATPIRDRWAPKNLNGFRPGLSALCPGSTNSLSPPLCSCANTLRQASRIPGGANKLHPGDASKAAACIESAERGRRVEDRRGGNYSKMPCQQRPIQSLALSPISTQFLTVDYTAIHNHLGSRLHAFG